MDIELQTIDLSRYAPATTVSFSTGPYERNATRFEAATFLGAKFSLNHDASPKLAIPEEKVLLLGSLGLTEGATGKQLYISEDTVGTHRSHLYDKLDVSSMPEAVDIAFGTGVFHVDVRISKWLPKVITDVTPLGARNSGWKAIGIALGENPTNLKAAFDYQRRLLKIKNMASAVLLTKLVAPPPVAPE